MIILSMCWCGIIDDTNINTFESPLDLTNINTFESPLDLTNINTYESQQNITINYNEPIEFGQYIDIHKIN
tara:strand:+ start:3807 stop:4019 length:213 start_codon:yes stop_codon:yes gene_type:complete